MSTIRKQIPLRLSKELYEQIAAWAADDFRSINGQIEYLLTECVRQKRKANGRAVDDVDRPDEQTLDTHKTAQMPIRHLGGSGVC